MAVDDPLATELGVVAAATDLLEVARCSELR